MTKLITTHFIKSLNHFNTNMISCKWGNWLVFRRKTISKAVTVSVRHTHRYRKMYDFCKTNEKEFCAMLFLKSANWVQLEILKEFHEFKKQAQYLKKLVFYQPLFYGASYIFIHRTQVSTIKTSELYRSKFITHLLYYDEVKNKECFEAVLVFWTLSWRRPLS